MERIRGPVPELAIAMLTAPLAAGLVAGLLAG
jgi:hypothetical protein